MKLSKHAFTRFWDVHAWIGVLGGLVLHVMFFAGGFALFHEDLSFWQERAPLAGATEAPRLATLVEKTLREHGVQPKELAVSIPGRRSPHLELSWPEQGKFDWAEVRLDPATGAAVVQASHLADILYWLHFLYHPKAAWGMYVAGVLAVALLLALVTGVLIHLKDIVRQFHQFRPTKAVKVLWSDLHKVLGVMGLPFQVMFAFTGAFLCLASLLLAVLAGPVFGGDEAAASASLWGGGRGAKPTGYRATILDLDRLIERAEEAVPGFRAKFVRLSHVGDQAATARVVGEFSGRLFGRGDVVLRATDGALLSESVTASATPGMTVNRWIVGLHYALYGGLATKVIYALLAAATCLTILSGNWIWLLRRLARASSIGNRLLAKMTIGLGGGVLLGTAALFWANRLAPAALRMTAESWAFFGVWGLATLLFLMRAETRGGWVGLLRLSGGAFALLPVASVVAADAHLLNAARHGRLHVLGVEVGLLLLGLALLFIGGIVGRYTRAAHEREETAALGAAAASGQEA